MTPVFGDFVPAFDPLFVTALEVFDHLLNRVLVDFERPPIPLFARTMDRAIENIRLSTSSNPSEGLNFTARVAGFVQKFDACTARSMVFMVGFSGVRGKDRRCVSLAFGHGSRCNSKSK